MFGHSLYKDLLLLWKGQARRKEIDQLVWGSEKGKAKEN